MKRSITALLLLGTAISSACANPYRVNLLGDLPDANPGDGICSAQINAPPDTATCTLRAAIQEANLDDSAVPSQIFIWRGKTYGLTIPGAAEQAAVRGDLDVLEPIKLIALGGKDKPRAIINANGLDRVLHFGANSGGSYVEGVELRGGWASNGRGVAAFVDGTSTADVDIEFDDVMVRANKPSSGSGSVAACAIEGGERVHLGIKRGEIRDNKSSGICLNHGGELDADRISVHHNSGFGITEKESSSRVLLSRASIFNNGFGVAIKNSGEGDRIHNSTIAANSSGAQLTVVAVEGSFGLDDVSILSSIIGTAFDVACDLGDEQGFGDENSVASSDCGGVPVADAGLIASFPNDGTPWMLIPDAQSPVLDAFPAENFGCFGRGEDQLRTLIPQGEGCEIGAVEVAN